MRRGNQVLSKIRPQVVQVCCVWCLVDMKSFCNPSMGGRGLVQLLSLWQTPIPLGVQISKLVLQCHSCCCTSSLPLCVQ